MKANARAINSNDEGVSPVIAVILMVAITVVLAATVYVWVSGFASDSGGPESASATAQGLDLDDDGDVEWVKITLVRGENAPYDELNDVSWAIVNVNGAVGAWVCQSADLDMGADALPNTADDECNNLFSGAADTWDVGQALFVPCRGALPFVAGNIALTFAVRDTTILDATINCDESPTVV